MGVKVAGGGSRFAAFKAPAACSKPLCGVQGSRRLRRVQSRFAAFKVQSSKPLCGVQGSRFKAALRRSRFKVQGSWFMVL